MNTSRENNTINPYVQVNVTHYNFDGYVNVGRWNSYWHQIVETMAFNPKKVLIIGIGDNIVGEVLAKQGVKVYTFDFDKELHPDFVGNIIDINNVLLNHHFDVVLCCQVLEHLPYEKFGSILQKLRQIADNVIISLPYSPINFLLTIKLPLIGSARVDINIHRFYKKLKINDEHYWEIGRKGYTKRKIMKSISNFFAITKCFIASNNHYHMFFILK
jgi:hypothetical protein